MTENEVIEVHIAENIHRIEVIEGFMYSNSDADKKICSKNISILTKINGLLQEIQQYRAIGTVSEFRELKEKATEKKAIDHFEFSPCPRCGSTETLGDGFCYVCGTER